MFIIQRKILLEWILAAFVALVASLRDYSAHGDTPRYATVFKATADLGYYPFSDNIIFGFFVEVIAHFTDSVFIYFYALGLLFTILNFYIYRRVLSFDGVGQLSYSYKNILIFFGFLLASGWFYAGLVNAIKQYFAILLLFSGLVVIRKSYFSSFLLFALGSLIHASIVPFCLAFLFFRLQLNSIFAGFCILALFYITGVNEILFAGLGTHLVFLLQFNPYDLIARYNDGEDVYYGFVFSIFIYTFLHGVLFWWFADRKVLGSSGLFLVKLYLIFSSMYFFMGVGPYSNRLAFVAWSLLPFIYSLIFLKIRLAVSLKRSFILIVLLLGVFTFSWRLFFYDI